MHRTALIASAILCALAVAVAAQGKINCSDAYKSLVERLERGDYGKMAPERLAIEKRKAQRIYHACVTGDLDNPRQLYERLDADKF